MSQARRGVHPRQSRAVVAAALLAAVGACGGPATTTSPPGAPAPSGPVAADTAGAAAQPTNGGPPEPVGPREVLTGADVVERRGAGGPLAGLRVGLITNHTGVTRSGRSTIDVLAALSDVQLVALFGPEHGIRGQAEAGVKVEGGRDAATGLPVYSLYDGTRTPTAEEMRGLDALVFDMQDVGARYYTYVWTMTEAMKAAADAGLRFVVLDRPNPIRGDVVQGNVQDTAFLSGIGLYPVAMRHGLTPGEIARFVAGEYHVDVDLDVVRAEGWSRDMWWDETGLDFIAPSPNMPSPESALDYPGTCLFEQTSLSVGRGLPTAFQQIGAPWLDNEELASRLNESAIPGVRFEPVRFPAVRPETQSHLGEKVPGERRGIRFVITDRDAYDPVRASVEALVQIEMLHPDRLEFAQNFDLIAGTDRVREMLEAGASADEIMRGWEPQQRAFEARRAKYLLYGVGSRGAASLDSRIRDLVAQAEARSGDTITLGVSWVDLETGRRYGLNEDVSMHAASTMKVPVLLELFRQAEHGRFDLDRDSIVVRNRFRSIVDGSPYSLTPTDDSDSTLYAMEGRGIALIDLARLMITRSSNFATNLLIDVVSADSVRATMRRLDARDMVVLRGVEDIPAYRAGMNNTATAFALGRVMEAIARCEILTRADCRRVIEILKGQEFTEKIPAGVPEGVPVANKTGWITQINHDAAIVFPPGRAPYVLVALTHGIRDEAVATDLIREVSKAVWEETTGR